MSDTKIKTSNIEPLQITHALLHTDMDLTGKTVQIAAPSGNTHPATKLYVDTAVANLVDSAPTSLDTLNELAAALNDDASFSTTVTTSLATKAPTSTTLTAGTGLTGGGDLSANRTFALDTSGVSAATYGSSSAIPSVVVDTYGRITSASATTIGGSITGTFDDLKLQYGTSYSGTPAQGSFFFDSLNQRLKIYTGSTFVDATPTGGLGYLALTGGTLTGDLTIPNKLIHAGDTDTYLQFGPDGNVSLYADGYQLMNGTSTSVTFLRNIVGFQKITTDGIGQFNDYIDLNTVGDRGKVGYDSNNVYIGSTASAGKIIFKNGITATDAPQTSGTELVTIDGSGRIGIGATGPVTGHKMTIKETATENASIVFTDTDDMVGAYVGMAKGNNEITTGATNIDLVLGTAYIADTHLIANNAIGLTLKNGGNVGIGDTTPTEGKLVVRGDANTNGLFVGGNSTTGQSYGALINAGTNSYDANFRLYDQSGSTPYLFVRGDGNVGIGTTSPTSNLTIGMADLGSAEIDFRAATYSRLGIIKVSHDSGTAESSMRFHTRTGGNEPEGMRITSGGNVGIGTQNPTYRLHVNSGSSNVVADFESTDGTAAIRLRDNSGNVELATASGGFQVQPGGGGSAMTVTSGGRLTAIDGLIETQSQVSSTPTGGTGWYTIATFPGSRSQGTIELYENGGSRHNHVKMEITWAYGQGAISIINGGRHSLRIFERARLMHVTSNQTYGGAILQIYFTNLSGTDPIYMKAYWPTSRSGWGYPTLTTNLQRNDAPSNYTENKILNPIAGANSSSKWMGFGTTDFIRAARQPSWNLRPNSSGNVTMGQSSEIIGWSAATNGSSGQFCHSTSVSLSASTSGTMNANSSGRINILVTGTYKIWCTIRCENTPGAGNIYLYLNGSVVARQHVEVWGRYNYAHGFHSHVAKFNQGDYIEWVVARSGGIVSGYNDTVNWAGGIMIG